MTVHTKSGRASRLIVHLYPLEMSTDECSVNGTSDGSIQQATEQQQDTCTSQDVTVP